MVYETIVSNALSLNRTDRTFLGVSTIDNSYIMCIVNIFSKNYYQAIDFMNGCRLQSKNATQHFFCELVLPVPSATCVEVIYLQGGPVIVKLQLLSMVLYQFGAF